MRFKFSHLYFFFLLSISLFCVKTGYSSELFLREVVAFYNPDNLETPLENPIVQNVEMPLNYLGLKVEYYDIREKFPSDTTMLTKRGVVLWLEDSSLEKATELWQWLLRQIDNKKYVVLLNGTNPIYDKISHRLVPLSVINRTLNALGVEKGEISSYMPNDIKIISMDTSMIEFERKLDNEYLIFQEFHSIDKNNIVYLKLQNISTYTSSDAVVTTSRGGVALDGYVIFNDPYTHKIQWRLNMFEFLARSLGLSSSPRLDCSTINGSRVFYSHIDGDGFTNISHIDDKSLSAEIILRDLLQKNTDIPVTVSIIIAELENLDYRERTHKIAKEIFRLDNVEAASHTYAHPLIWNLSLLSGNEAIEYSGTLSEKRLNNGVMLAFDIPGYNYSPDKEIVYSVDYINKYLLPKDKTCRILLWSGNCMPDEAALAMCYNNKIINMNGGDTRLDDNYPSYAYVKPLYRKVGSYYQIYSSNTNENLFTDQLTYSFGEFQNNIHTFINTGSPYLIKPVNVYYHFYSGEHISSVYAIQTIYDWVRSQNLFRAFSSFYIQMVEGFIDANIIKEKDDRWHIENYGNCRTVRFDAVNKYPDLKKSENVVGYSRDTASVYVYLDTGVEAVVVLSNSQTDELYLKKSTALVSNLKRLNGKSATFTALGFSPMMFSWKNFQPNTGYIVQISATSINKTIEILSSADGELDFVINPSPGVFSYVSVSISPSRKRDKS